MERRWAESSETRIFEHPAKGEVYVRDTFDNWRVFYGYDFAKMFLAALPTHACRRVADYTGECLDIGQMCDLFGWVRPGGLVSYPWHELQAIR